MNNSVLIYEIRSVREQCLKFIVKSRYSFLQNTQHKTRALSNSLFIIHYLAYN